MYKIVNPLFSFMITLTLDSEDFGVVANLETEQMKMAQLNYHPE